MLLLEHEKSRVAMGERKEREEVGEKEGEKEEEEEERGGGRKGGRE